VGSNYHIVQNSELRLQYICYHEMIEFTY
jgi:hypothetical protein